MGLYAGLLGWLCVYCWVPFCVRICFQAFLLGLLSGVCGVSVLNWVAVVSHFGLVSVLRRFG